MKRILVWLRDQVGGNFLGGLFLLWVSSDAIKGFYSQAMLSGEDFSAWLKGPVLVSRWVLLLGLLWLVYVAGRLAIMYWRGRKLDSIKQEADEGPLSEDCAAVLEAISGFESAGNEPDSFDLKAETGISKLRVDHAIDLLEEKKMIDRRGYYHPRTGPGEVYSLLPAGRACLISLGSE